MAIFREMVDQLERAQESRQLTLEEGGLIKHLKSRIFGLAAIEKSQARQKSRITWLRKGDANTKKFQVMANIRKQWNFIHSPQTENSVVMGQKNKRWFLITTCST
jgi:hypothetical protein